MRWTHKPTQKDGKATDRTVYVSVARIYQIEHGPDAGRWAYFPQWGGSEGSGVHGGPTADSLEIALDFVRKSYMHQFKVK
ncbi:MAG: hypothetical protein ABJN26_00135 [Stappiaceae bacterium]